MKTLTIHPVLAASIGVLFGLATLAAPRAQSATDASMSDKHFVSEALKGGMAEIQMGRLAQEKGSSRDVKNFGRKMVQDHTKLGDQMKQVASQLGNLSAAESNHFRASRNKKAERTLRV